MAGIRLLYQRIYGYICVLLLLHEFHVVMLQDHPKQLLPHSRSLQPNDQPKEETEREIIYGLSSIHMNMVRDLAGNLNNIDSSKVELRKYKSSTANGLKKLPSVMKEKMKEIGNVLAENAQNKITKLVDIKRSKPESHIRRKRAPKNRSKNKAPKASVDVNVQRTSAFVTNPSKETLDNFAKLLKAARRNNVNLTGTQNAHFGLVVNKEGFTSFDKESVHSKVLSEVDEFPLDKNYKKIEKLKKNGQKPQTHTEQALYDDINKQIKQKCNGQGCELYLWTKNSPCMKNTYKLNETVEHAKSCFELLVELCRDHVRNTKSFKMCHIGFRDFYGLTGDLKKDTKKEFMDELKKFTGTVKNLEPSTSNISHQKTFADLQSFIKFYQIIP